MKSQTLVLLLVAAVVALIGWKVLTAKPPEPPKPPKKGSFEKLGSMVDTGVDLYKDANKALARMFG